MLENGHARHVGIGTDWLRSTLYVCLSICTDYMTIYYIRHIPEHLQGLKEPGMYLSICTDYMTMYYTKSIPEHLHNYMTMLHTRHIPEHLTPSPLPPSILQKSKSTP